MTKQDQLAATLAFLQELLIDALLLWAASLVEGKPGAAGSHLEISKGKLVTEDITEESKTKRWRETDSQ